MPPPVAATNSCAVLRTPRGTARPLRRLVAMGLTVAGGALFSAAALALDFALDFGPGFDVSWTNKFAAGAQWRLESPDTSLIGKSNLDPSLCAEDACISLSRDNLEPHQRWMAAPGANWQIGDEANLAHQKGDVTSAVTRWRSDMTITGGDGTWGLQLGWQTFYDAVLDRLLIAQPNLIVEEGAAPGVATAIPLPPKARDEAVFEFDLRDANLFFRVPYVGGREIDVRIGRQQLGWGEALFAISGTLNYINPVDFNNFFRPTMDLDEALEPVAMAHVRTAFTERIFAEAYYQLEWRPYTLPARGTLGSFIADIGTEAENSGRITDDSFPLPFGKTPEDPLQQQRALTPVVALISDTAASVPRLNNREPGHDGQYGLKVSMFGPEWTNNADFSLYYGNYHARLPAVSFLAADATCAASESSATGEDAQPGIFPVGLLNFLQACGRDVSNLAELLGLLDANGDTQLVADGFDALPIDTARVFLEFPRNIQVFGLGVNTTAFGMTLTGEIAYRPDYPFQIDLEDVFFAALNPIFPRNELPLFPAEAAALDAVLGPLGNLFNLPLDQLAGATFTDRRNALPDFITGYRGGEPGEIEPNSYIRGYEEFDYWQGTFGANWIFGRSNGYLWADQMVLLLEFAATYVPDLPALNELQLDSLATTNTHFTPGIEETGDALKLNPFATRSGFPTKFAWGYKAAAIWSYNNLLMDGLRIRPQVILFHDVDGITPGLGGNFQEGRKIGLVGVNFNFSNQINLTLDQFLFFGGGNGNRLADRDFLNVAVSYSF